MRAKLLHGTYVPKQTVQDASIKAREAALDSLIAALKERGADTAPITG